MSSPAEPAQVLIVRREQLQAARAGRHRQATGRWWKEPKLWLCPTPGKVREHWQLEGGGVRLRHRKGRQAWEEILRSSATLSQSHFFSHSLLQALRLADDSNCSFHLLTSNQSQSALASFFLRFTCKHPNGRGQPTAWDSRSALALQLHRPFRFFPGRLLLQAARKARQRVIKNRAKQTISRTEWPCRST